MSLASVASDLSATTDGIKMPNVSSMQNAITIPDDAMPVVPPVFTNPTISAMPMFEDQNFTQNELVVLPQPGLQTLSPTFEVFTTEQQVLSIDNAYIMLRGFIKTASGFAASGNLAVNFQGTNGDQYVWPNGGIFSLVQNLTISINGTALPNYQSGNVIAQMYTHPVQHPRMYMGGIGLADNTQIKTAQGTMGIDQFYNRNAQSVLKPFLDFTGITATAASPTVGQYVYFKIPLKNIWAFYQQSGRFFTNDAQMRFNFVLSGLTINGTQTMSLPQVTAGNVFGTVAGDVATTLMPNFQVISQPVTFTMTDMLLVYPMYNCTAQLKHMIEAHVIESPLAMTMSNVEVYQETTVSNLDLTNVANWGLGPTRTLIKGSGYLPHFAILVPTVTVGWAPTGTGATLRNPFGIAGFTWSRSIIAPGMIYPRRIYLGGQPYYDDMVLSQFGITNVMEGIGGWTQFVEKRAKILQQQGNYADAPDQNWLNCYANATQLAPTNAISADFLDEYSTVNIGMVQQAWKVGNWAMGLGVNGMSLSQDPSFDTLTIARSQSFEMEFMTMPYWGKNFVPDFTAPAPQLMFMGIDNVWTAPPSGDTQPFLKIPSTCTMSLQYALPYTMIADYGRGRMSQYAYAQPLMPGASNVPM